MQQLWLAFGQGQNPRWIPVHGLCCTLAEKSKGMLFFHAFTGCDIVSAFRGKGKKSAFQTWDVCDEASGVFCKLSKYPPVVDDEDLETLEKFVVMMYDRSSTAEGVDAARLDMFARKQRPYEAIPPTQGALKQHVKRTAYQSGNSASTGNADSCQLGLDKDRRFVARHLDRAPTHCRKLSAADLAWLQVRMLRTMQVLLLWSDLHCTLQLQM